MNKKDIQEIKKQFTQENCAVTRLCGCYVDGEKKKKTQIKEAFLSLPEEEIFKYFEIFKKTLSGTVGRNIINMEFPLQAEAEGGAQEFLLKLRDSRLTDTEILEQFYDKIVESYDYGENYLILLIHAAYDIPGKAKDGTEMFDASDEVYEYLLCSICPVNLSKPGLSYNAEENCFHNRIRDWVVEMPETGFLFPAFTERSTDLHSMAYYTKKPEALHGQLIENVFGCALPMTAGSQRESFNALIENTLGEQCDFESVKTIHEKLNEMVQIKKEDPEPLTLDKNEIKSLLLESGVERKKLEEDFDAQYEVCNETDQPLVASNVTNARKFEIKTPDIVISVNPDRTDLVETRIIDGQQCLVIRMNDHVEINGIAIRTDTTL